MWGLVGKESSAMREVSEIQGGFQNVFFSPLCDTAAIHRQGEKKGAGQPGNRGLRLAFLPGSGAPYTQGLSKTPPAVGKNCRAAPDSRARCPNSTTGV